MSCSSIIGRLAITRTCRTLFPHIAAILWQYTSAHVLVACPTTPEHCRQVYALAVHCLCVCDCKQVSATERDLCAPDYHPLLLLPPGAR
jgi:hypothetical protein